MRINIYDKTGANVSVIYSKKGIVPYSNEFIEKNLIIEKENCTLFEVLKKDLINIPKRIMIIVFFVIIILSILKIDENNYNVSLLILNVSILAGLFVGGLEVRSTYNKYCNDYVIEREWIGDIVNGRACNGYGMKEK